MNFQSFVYEPGIQKPGAKYLTDDIVSAQERQTYRRELPNLILRRNRHTDESPPPLFGAWGCKKIASYPVAKLEEKKWLLKHG